jgi:hypothetical protein
MGILPILSSSIFFGKLATEFARKGRTRPAPSCLPAGVEQATLVDQKDLTRIEVAEAAQMPRGIGQAFHPPMGND